MNRKSGGLNRPSKGDDAPSPGPKKKGDSGHQKPLKKTSARKPVDEDAAEEEAPKKKTGRSSARGSARQGGGGAPRPDNSENIKKGFLFSVPILMIVLIAAGVKLAMKEEKGPTVIKLDYQGDIDKARGMFGKAKQAYEAGKAIEGDAGTAKVREAMKLCQDALEIINKVRDSIGEAEQKKGQQGVQNYDFEQTLEPQINSLLKEIRYELGKR